MSDAVTEIFDLDAAWEKEAAEKHLDTEVEYRKVRILGQDWRVSKDGSPTATLEFMENPDAQLTFVLGFLHPDERDLFRKRLDSEPNLTLARVSFIADALMKGVTGFPTVQPPASPTPSEPTGTSGTASSSGEPAAPPAPPQAPPVEPPAAFAG